MLPSFIVGIPSCTNNRQTMVSIIAEIHERGNLQAVSFPACSNSLGDIFLIVLIIFMFLIIKCFVNI